MRVTSVEYRRLQTFGEFENETAGIVVEVGEHDDADVVMQTARAWVDAQLAGRVDARDAVSHLRRAEARLSEVNALLKESEKRWSAAQKILAAAGVEVPKDWGARGDDFSEVPF